VRRSRVPVVLMRPRPLRGRGGGRGRRKKPRRARITEVNYQETLFELHSSECELLAVAYLDCGKKGGYRDLGAEVSQWVGGRTEVFLLMNA